MICIGVAAPMFCSHEYAKAAHVSLVQCVAGSATTLTWFTTGRMKASLADSLYICKYLLIHKAPVPGEIPEASKDMVCARLAPLLRAASMSSHALSAVTSLEANRPAPADISGRASKPQAKRFELSDNTEEANSTFGVTVRQHRRA